MVSSEYETILQWHPEMILISKTPMIWKGFLSSSCESNDGQTVRVKLKLCVPNYPSLRNAQLYFGKKISDLRDTDFNRKVNELMQNVTKVSTFLRQLQSLLSDTFGNTYETSRIIGNSSMDIIQELQSTLQTPSEVMLSSNDNLNTIRLSLRNISLTLQRNDYSIYPWKVVTSDLPELPGFDPFEKGISSLSVARNKFKLHVEMLEKSWAHLQEIDEHGMQRIVL
ncbi:hypothetical protein KM043_001477 [Ampulex compressa]|nr:hypothetical protein KM043_001477 [Ampulex compressa]